MSFGDANKTSALETLVSHVSCATTCSKIESIFPISPMFFLFARYV